jgi:hypothetical protein
MTKAVKRSQQLIGNINSQKLSVRLGFSQTVSNQSAKCSGPR